MAFLARLLLKQLLADPAVKKKLFDELRLAAKKTEETRIDDYAVDAFEAIYTHALPILLGKL